MPPLHGKSRRRGQALSRVFGRLGPALSMPVIRHCLRSFVLVWLVFQVIGLSAFVPTGCCAMHQRAGEDTPCHGDDGSCPMHRAAAAVDAADVECPLHAAAPVAPSAPSPCVMRGLCHGPLAAVSLLFPVFGIPVPLFHLEGGAATAVASLDLQFPDDTVTPHDTPPPRS